MYIKITIALQRVQRPSAKLKHTQIHKSSIVHTARKEGSLKKKVAEGHLPKDQGATRFQIHPQSIKPNCLYKSLKPVLSTLPSKRCF